MQMNKNDYNPEIHDKFRGLSVKNPYASLLTRIAYIDEDGNTYARKTIEVRSRNTSYRGDILICSSAKPVLPGMMSGVTLGLVELYDVKPVKEFTAEDWAATCIPVQDRPQKGWGWLMRNPRPVVEMPVSGQLGFYDVIVPKGVIIEYPRVMAMGKNGWNIVKNKIKAK